MTEQEIQCEIDKIEPQYVAESREAETLSLFRGSLAALRTKVESLIDSYDEETLIMFTADGETYVLSSTDARAHAIKQIEDREARAQRREQRKVKYDRELFEELKARFEPEVKND